jgi:hypothetical protein
VSYARKRAGACRINVLGTNLERTRESNFCSYCEYFMSDTMYELDDFPSNAETYLYPGSSASVRSFYCVGSAMRWIYAI